MLYGIVYCKFIKAFTYVFLNPTCKMAAVECILNNILFILYYINIIKGTHTIYFSSSLYIIN